MKTRWKALLSGLLAMPLAASASGGPGPAPSPAPSPSPVGTERVSVLLYFDEDGDGRMTASEGERIPGAEVVAGSARGTTGVGDGRAVLGGLVTGPAEVDVRQETLPPYYQAPAPAAIAVPRPQDLELGATLPTGSNFPYRYMAFGDSITLGDGSSDNRGYLPQLQRDLQEYFGVAEFANEGVDGSKSWQGADRIADALRRDRPSWVLVHYGTNDWNHCREVASCPTEDSLRAIVRAAKAAHTMPVLATVIPSNTDYLDPGAEFTKAPAQRNEYVAEQGRMIRKVAMEERVALADLEAAFLAETKGDLASFFVDHVHPNDRGYAIMAREFFKALTTPSATADPALAGDVRTLPALVAPARRPGAAFALDD